MFQKIILCTVCFFAINFFVAAQVSPQDSGISPSNYYLNNKFKDDDGKIKKNIFKVNLTGLAMKNYAVQYERIISKRSSLALGVRYMPESTLPFKSIIRKEVDKYATSTVDNDTYESINNARLGNKAITPEYRYYFGKGYGKGFYLALYYRYAEYNINKVSVNYGSNSVPKSVDLNGSFSSHTGGLMAGAQWNLSKSITFDWWILGASYGVGKGSGIGVNSKNFTEQDKIDIKRELDNMDIPLTRLTYEINDNNVKVKLDGPWAGVRAGLTLGIKF